VAVFAITSIRVFFAIWGVSCNQTDVGAYTGPTSPYGAFDMGGNVYQWNEALISGSSRGLRGGSFNNVTSFLLSSNRGSGPPSLVIRTVGFRVASDVPEPSTGVLAVIACGMMWWRRRRFRYRSVLLLFRTLVFPCAGLPGRESGPGM
jgi:sulfatase-modifying factor enzyme 1/PEP-CTERM motif-containing protein